MNARLLSILACPDCRGQLHSADQELVCQRCGNAFAVQNEVAIFLPSADVVSPEHVSNAIGAEYESILREGSELVLHIGAGASAARYPNCVELERKIFRHTDVVGDVHRLPFRDQVFDRVFAFNVFEHLREPSTAAREIFRVLKPAGSVAIHSAFLQPLHEEPAHFYNASAYGLREWFGQFEIERCHVSPNFSPAYTLGFLTSTVLETVRSAGATAEEVTLLARSSLGEWATFWNRRSNPPPGFVTLQNLPQALQQRIAAGFELIARRPTNQPS
jgi:uncharacterized protein YbaR (Trm112 family)